MIVASVVTAATECIRQRLVTDLSNTLFLYFLLSIYPADAAPLASYSSILLKYILIVTPLPALSRLLRYPQIHSLAVLDLPLAHP